jgi:hypothetical protein
MTTAATLGRACSTSLMNKGDEARSKGFHFRLWHETVMPVLSPQVRYEGMNGPGSVAV